jgi:hypothetical protein
MKTKLTIIASTLVLMVSLSGFVFLTNANYKVNYATSSNNDYHSMCFNPIVDFTNGTTNSLNGNIYSTLKPGTTLTHTVDLDNRNTNVDYKVNLLMTATSYYGYDDIFLFRSGTPISVTAALYDTNGTMFAGSSQTLNFTSLSSSTSNVSFDFNGKTLPAVKDAKYTAKITYTWLNADQTYVGAPSPSYSRYNPPVDPPLGAAVSDELGTTTDDLGNAGVCALNYTSDDLFQNNEAKMVYSITFTQS